MCLSMADGFKSAFKDRWGSKRHQLTYHRYNRNGSPTTQVGEPGNLSRAVFSRLPDPLLILSGRLLYRHKG